MFFHLFVTALIYFISVLDFSVYKSFTSLVKFSPKNFIHFDAIVNESVSSFLDSLLLMCKMQLIFCIFISHHVSLLICSLVPTAFCSLYKKDCIHTDIFFYIQEHFVCWEYFTSPFLMWTPFIFFSCLIALARVCVEKCSETRHSRYILDLRVKCFCFTPLSMTLTVGIFIYGLCWHKYLLYLIC